MKKFISKLMKMIRKIVFFFQRLFYYWKYQGKAEDLKIKSTKLDINIIRADRVYFGGKK